MVTFIYAQPNQAIGIILVRAKEGSGSRKICAYQKL